MAATAVSVLSQRDIMNAEVVFSIYDFTGKEYIDAYNLGDALRALNLNPTLSLIQKLGGTQRKGEKKLKLDEFLPLVAQAKMDKDVGVYEDFFECLRMYDKNAEGKMMHVELTHILRALGERLSDKECEEIVKDCLDEEDEDGFVEYKRE